MTLGVFLFQMKEAAEQASDASQRIIEVGVTGAILVIAIIGIGIMYWLQRKDISRISDRHAGERKEWMEADAKRAEAQMRLTQQHADIIVKNTDALTQLSTLIDERVPKSRRR
jgi:hypothetical protein